MSRHGWALCQQVRRDSDNRSGFFIQWTCEDKKLSEEKGRLVVNEEHYAELRRRRRRTSTPELERQFLERFPRQGSFLQALKRALRSIAPCA